MRSDHFEVDLTHLSEWFARGRLLDWEYQALMNWREDGGGVRRPRPAGAKGKREDDGDHMAENAKRRHKAIFRYLDRINADAAQAIHRLCMVDDPNVSLEHVKIGALVVNTKYQEITRRPYATCE